MNDTERKDLFYCYSKNVLQFMENKDIYYIDKDTHRKTSKNYWVYEKDENFLSALEEFTKNKRENKNVFY